MPYWFPLLFVPMVASQIARLYQHDAMNWLLLDYAGRLTGLAILAAIPNARSTAFKQIRVRVTWLELAVWIAGIVVFAFYVGHPVMHAIDRAIPGTRLGGAPDPHGMLRWFDMTFGLALVAFHEEIVFRRAARFAFGKVWGDGWRMVVATALVFGAYHWWTGLGNIAYATLFGMVAMLALRRLGAIWPIVLAHYLVDAITFYA